MKNFLWRFRGVPLAKQNFCSSGALLFSIRKKYGWISVQESEQDLYVVEGRGLLLGDSW
jgi:hypothetical protein